MFTPTKNVTKYSPKTVLGGMLSHQIVTKLSYSLMAYRDQYDLRQGRIQLYRRTAEGGKHPSNSWYCALKIPGQKTIRRSLKTCDQDRAERLAKDLWFDLNQRSEQGLSLSTKRFELVASTSELDLLDIIFG